MNISQNSQPSWNMPMTLGLQIQKVQFWHLPSFMGFKIHTLEKIEIIQCSKPV